MSLVERIPTDPPTFSIPSLVCEDGIPGLPDDATAIYTDGSWYTTTPEHLKLFFPIPSEDQQCTAGIVIAGITCSHIRVPDITNPHGTNNYMAEAVGVALGCMIRKEAQILLYTDCKSLIDKLKVTQFNTS
jgi:hypothetical protein